MPSRIGHRTLVKNIRFAFDDFIFAPLDRMNAEPDPFDAVGCEGFHTKRMQCRRVRAGIDFRLNCRKIQGQNCDPFTSTDQSLSPGRYGEKLRIAGCSDRNFSSLTAAESRTTGNSLPNFARFSRQNSRGAYYDVADSLDRDEAMQIVKMQWYGAGRSKVDNEPSAFEVVGNSLCRSNMRANSNCPPDIFDP